MTATAAEKCCECGSDHVTYHNYLDQPFCAPCADGPAPVPAAAAPPVPLFRGRVSIFSTPDGSLLIVYRPEGEQEDRREIIPAVALGMAGQFAAMFGGGQNPLSLMTRLAGGRG